MAARYHYSLALPLSAADGGRLCAAVQAKIHGPCQSTGVADGASRKDSVAGTEHMLLIAKAAESHLPHPFLRQRMSAALPETLPHGFDVSLTRITQTHSGMAHSGMGGIPSRKAYVRPIALGHPTAQSARDIAAFLGTLTPYLAAQSLSADPLRPHIPLSAALAEAASVPPSVSAKGKIALPLAFGWTAQRLILWESDDFTGLGRTVTSWSLPPPVQGSLPFPIAA